MTQHELVIKYCEEFGSILPAKQHGFPYKDGFLGSETGKRCRELTVTIQGEWQNPYGKQMLRRESEGKFKRFYLLNSAPQLYFNQNPQPKPKELHPQAEAFLKQWAVKPPSSNKQMSF